MILGHMYAMYLSWNEHSKCICSMNGRMIGVECIYTMPIQSSFFFSLSLLIFPYFFFFPKIILYYMYIRMKCRCKCTPTDHQRIWHTKNREEENISDRWNKRKIYVYVCVCVVRVLEQILVSDNVIHVLLLLSALLFFVLHLCYDKMYACICASKE